MAIGTVGLTACLFVGVFEVRERAGYRAWRSERAAHLESEGLVVESADKVLIWENRPGATKGIHAINRWGFRDDDYPSREKPAGEYRVAFVGDSVTYGEDVTAGERFVSLIAARARHLENDGAVQVMNFSVMGYNTIQIAELIRAKVLGFFPDQVVYVLCLNDFDFDDASGQLVRYFRPPVSFLWERLKRPRVVPDVTEYHVEHFAKHRDEVFATIRGTAALLAERHITFRVVVAPIFDFARLSFNDYPLSSIHSAVDQALRDAGIPSVDLLPMFQQCASRGPAAYALDVWHLNPLGHRFFADALFDSVLAGRVPVRAPDALCDSLKALAPEETAGERQAFEATLATHAPARLAPDSSLLSLEGFWPLERSDSRTFVWSQARSLVHIEGLRPGGVYRVKLEVRDTGNRSTVSFGPVGGPFETVPVSPSAVEPAKPEIASSTGSLHVELRTETWRPSDRGGTDTRDLGIAINGIEIEALP